MRYTRGGEEMTHDTPAAPLSFVLVRDGNEEWRAATNLSAASLVIELRSLRRSDVQEPGTRAAALK
jgi:hypothetical protein